MNKKIIVASVTFIIIILIITSWILFSGLLSNNSLDSTPKEKIFLLGSSTVYSVNSTFVNNYFAKNDVNYEFFNLADMSDSPKKRIHSISNIISNNPAIVIYGIDVGDFRTETKNEISLEEIVIHPKNFFLYQFASRQG